MRKPPQPPRQTLNKAAKQKANTRKRETGRVIWKIINTVFFTIGCLVVIASGASIGYFTALLRGLPTISASTFSNMNSASVVLDRTGQLIGRFTRDGDRQPITSIDQVSPDLVSSFIAAEDKTFYNNIGINPLAMVRALSQDLVSHNIESGASTITQQTVKLAVFPQQQRTLKRKVQEIALALQLTQLLSKDEILTDYMNWVYMGRMGSQNVYGVKTASEVLFHKDPKHLNLPQSAFLAAIVNNPSLFSPYVFPKHTVDRQHRILREMAAHGVITQAAYDSAIHYNVLKDIKPGPTGYQKNPYLMGEVEPVVDNALVQAGLYETTQQADAALPVAGYRIYTTLDMKLQGAVDSVLSNDQLFRGTDLPVPGLPGSKDLYQAGVTLIDNQTGAILAIGGGRKPHYREDSFDHSDLARQPGSSIKPLIDYGPAIDLQQLTAGDVLDDAPTVFEKGKPWQYSPHDDESYWHGIVTARQALVESLNVPAVEVLNRITPQLGTSYLAQMGVPAGATTIAGKPTLTAADRGHIGAAIGGLEYGLTVQQLTSAYTVFPNQGVWRQSYLISHVTDPSGSQVYQAQPEIHRVFSAQTAYIMTSILHDVVYSPLGTAISIGRQFPGENIAGKTGTSDRQENGWFVGFTPEYTMGIWMGYNHNQPIPQNFYNLKFTIWSDIMKRLTADHKPTQAYLRPSGIVDVPICSKSGQLPTSLCKQDNDVYTELFISGTEPTLPCQVHTALAYTVLNGHKYLATTNTPPGMIRKAVFLSPPWPVPAATTLDSAEYAPTALDPRGGTALNSSDPAAPKDNPAATASLTPQNTVVTNTPEGIKVSWNPVQGAFGYTVLRSTSLDMPFAEVAGPMQQTAFIDTSVPAGATTLYYEVISQTAAGNSPPSRPVSLTLASSAGSQVNAASPQANALGGAQANAAGVGGQSTPTQNVTTDPLPAE